MKTKQKASKLDAFAERLEEMFLAGTTLKDAQEQLRLDGCAVSLGRLSEWWQGRQAERQEAALLTQIATGAASCRRVEQELSQNPAPELATLLALHRTLILKLSTQGALDPQLLELVNRMMDRVIKGIRLDQLEQRNKLDERRIALLEDRAKQAGEAEGIVRAELSAEEKVQRMRAVFGMA